MASHNYFRFLSLSKVIIGVVGPSGLRTSYCIFFSDILMRCSIYEKELFIDHSFTLWKYAILKVLNECYLLPSFFFYN